MGRLLTIILSASLLLLSGCGKNEIKHEQEYKFAHQDWNRFVKPEFTFDIKDTEAVYDIVMVGNFNHNIQVSALNTDIMMLTPDGGRRASNVLWPIKDDEGQPMGEQLDGKFTNEIYLRKDFTFNQKGKLQFQIEYRSSKYDNPDINAVGIRVIEKKQ